MPALLIFGVAFSAFTVLLWLGKIGEASYCFLVAVSGLMGFVVHGFPRLQELDLKSLKLVLREIRETKQELFVREERLKAIAVPLAQVIAFTGAAEGRFGSAETTAAKRAWYRAKIRQLADALGMSAQELRDTEKYAEKFAEIDSLLGDDGLKTTQPDYEQRRKRIDSLADDVLSMLRDDVAVPPRT